MPVLSLIFLGQKLTTGQQGKLMTEQASKLLERTTQKTQLKSIQKTELLPRLITRPMITQRSKLVVVPKLIQKQQTKLKTIQVPRIPFVPETKLKIPRIPFFVLPQLRKKQRKQNQPLNGKVVYPSLISKVSIKNTISSTEKRKLPNYSRKKDLANR